MAVRKHCGIADPDYEVEFHKTIASMIPLLIKRLEDKNYHVRLAATKQIGKLANYGGWQLEALGHDLPGL